MTRFSHTQQGVALVILAMACFVGIDTTTKYVGAFAPLIMVLWSRYVVQAALTTSLLLPRRGRLLFRTQHPRLQLLRGLLMVGSSMLAIASLKVLPVGDFTALMMLSPMLITLCSALALGERVPAVRWVLLTGSFAGAMIVIRPGADDFNWATLLALLLVVCNTCFNLLTAYLARDDDGGTMHFYTGVVATAVASVALPFAWQTPAEPGMWLWMALVGVFSTLGHFFLILAYGRARPSTLTPYLYFQIAFATLSGWLFFSHTPDRWSLVGILMIAVCGVTNTWLSGRNARLTEPEPML